MLIAAMVSGLPVGEDTLICIHITEPDCCRLASINQSSALRDKA